jgi:hypothetical protein
MCALVLFCLRLKLRSSSRSLGHPSSPLATFRVPLWNGTSRAETRSCFETEYSLVEVAVDLLARAGDGHGDVVEAPLCKEVGDGHPDARLIHDEFRGGPG